MTFSLCVVLAAMPTEMNDDKYMYRHEQWEAQQEGYHPSKTYIGIEEETLLSNFRQLLHT